MTTIYQVSATPIVNAETTIPNTQAPNKAKFKTVYYCKLANPIEGQDAGSTYTETPAAETELDPNVIIGYKKGLLTITPPPPAD